MKKEEFEKLGRNIKYYRTQKGMSCANLAKILQRQEKVLVEMEEGKRIYQLKTLEKIAKALGKKVTDIFTE